MLLGIGLQNKTVDALETDLKLEARQLLANFNKVCQSQDISKLQTCVSIDLATFV